MVDGTGNFSDTIAPDIVERIVDLERYPLLDPASPAYRDLLASAADSYLDSLDFDEVSSPRPREFADTL